MPTTTPKAVEPATSLTEALAQVQAGLPHIQKNKTAQVQMKGGGSYSYKYADLADIQPLVLPLLAAQGLSWVTRPTVVPEVGLALAYELTHTSGEQIGGVYPLPDARVRTPQELGSALTYARRYVLCCVVGIVPDEDEDGALAVSAQKEADARREEERRERQEAEVGRSVLLDRARVAAESLGRPLGDVALAFQQQYGSPIGATMNLDGLDTFVTALEAEADRASAQAAAAAGAQS